jgi:hypothetical protein
MIWARGCIHCKEGSSLCASDVVIAGDVDNRADNVIDIDVVHPSGVNGDVKNQESTLNLAQRGLSCPEVSSLEPCYFGALRS